MSDAGENQDAGQAASIGGSEARGGSTGSRAMAKTLGPASMNHLLFPARGMPRPILGQVLSAPSLRTEFMAHENVPDRTQYRESWDDLMSHLDVQCAQRKDDHKRRIETEIAVLKTRDSHKRMENSEAMFERPDWTYCDPADYFEKPRPGTLQEPSNQYHKNDLLQGMYTCSEYKPPHWEYNVHGGWSPFDRNLRGRSLDMFGTKVPRQMDPKEKMYAERLEKKLAKAKAKEKQDVLERTMGIYKKKKIEANADPFSCLKRELPAWQDQRVYTHEIFSEPERDKPGDHEYETGLPEHITQPDRALSYERDFICGDPERTTAWKAPKAGVLKGSKVRALRAKVLLCPPGCHELKAEIEKELRSPAAQGGSPKARARAAAAAAAAAGGTMKRSASEGGLLGAARKALAASRA